MPRATVFCPHCAAQRQGSLGPTGRHFLCLACKQTTVLQADTTALEPVPVEPLPLAPTSPRAVPLPVVLGATAAGGLLLMAALAGGALVLWLFWSNRPANTGQSSPVPRLSPLEVCRRFATYQGQTVEVEGEAIDVGGGNVVLNSRPLRAHETTAVEYANRLAASSLEDDRGVLAQVQASGPVILRGKVARKESGWVHLEGAEVVTPR